MCMSTQISCVGQTSNSQRMVLLLSLVLSIGESLYSYLQQAKCTTPNLIQSQCSPYGGKSSISKSHQFFSLNSSKIYTYSLILHHVILLYAHHLLPSVFNCLTPSLPSFLHSTRKRIQNSNLICHFPLPTSQRSSSPVSLALTLNINNSGLYNRPHTSLKLCVLHM